MVTHHLNVKLAVLFLMVLALPLAVYSNCGVPGATVKTPAMRLGAFPGLHNKPRRFFKPFHQPPPKPVTAKVNPIDVLAANCSDINWTTWTDFSGTSATGAINNNGTNIGVTMTSNFQFGSTPGIYNYGKFSAYPSPVPNATVPETTWAAGAGGLTTMCFSQTVTNPVLLIASLGSSVPVTTTLSFSLPYVVLYDGGGMVYDNSTTISGTEGYAIIMFPGTFSCVTINSSTPEYYTNITWGIRPPPFNIDITESHNGCGNDVLTADGGVSYKWNGGDTPDQATNTFHQSGTYIVTVTNAAGCSTAASKTITVSQAPPVITSFSFPQQAEPAVIDAVNHTITVKVNENTDVTRLTPQIALNNGSVSPASGATLDFTKPVTFTVSNPCSSETYQANVVVVVPDKIEVCQSYSNVLLSSNLLTAGATYQWQIYSNGSWTNTSAGDTLHNYLAFTPLALPSTEVVSYRCVVTAGGSVTYSPYDDVYFIPVLKNDSIAADRTVICAGDIGTVNFTGNIPGGGAGTALYFWQQSADNQTWNNIAGATQQNLQYPFNGTQTLYFRRKTSSGGCDDFSNVIMVSYAGPVTIANAGPDQSLCGLEQATLSANPPATGEVGTWSVLTPASYNPFSAATVNDPNAVISNLPTDTPVTLQWTIVKSQCAQQSSATVHVQRNSVPLVVAGNPVTINRGDKTTLNGNITGNYATFSWSPADGLSNPDILNPVASPAQTTTYTLTATTNAGCTVQDSVKIIVLDQIAVPNTFTPNADGINDKWNILHLSDYQNCRVDIYNRYGTPVFHSIGYAIPWDGTAGGKPVPDGTYYYIISLQIPNSKPMAGFVSVLR